MEVLLVLAILVILGTLVVTNFSGILASSKIKAAKAQLNALEQPIDIYQLDVGTYPTTQQGLAGAAHRASGSGRPEQVDWAYAEEGHSARSVVAIQYYYELLSPTQYQDLSRPARMVRRIRPTTSGHVGLVLRRERCDPRPTMV